MPFARVSWMSKSHESYLTDGIGRQLPVSMCWRMAPRAVRSRHFEGYSAMFLILASGWDL
jgi:hypothetical protein